MAIMYFPLKGQTSVNCTVASNYGVRQGGAGVSTYHKGIDLSANTGHEILCAYAGTVQANYGIGESGSRGNTIVVTATIEPFGLCYMYYQHMMQKSTLKVGDSIKAGDLIGYVGGSGATSTTNYAPHLHFGISIGGKEDWYRKTCARYDNYPTITQGSVDPATATWLGIDNGEVVPLPDEPPPPIEPTNGQIIFIESYGDILIATDTENNRYIYSKISPRMYQRIY